MCEEIGQIGSQYRRMRLVDVAMDRFGNFNCLVKVFFMHGDLAEGTALANISRRSVAWLVRCRPIPQDLLFAFATITNPFSLEVDWKIVCLWCRRRDFDGDTKIW